MPSQFAKPPLVELIAEVRWGAVAQATVVAPQPGPLMVNLGTRNNESEGFFFHLGAKLAEAGFRGVERLMPFDMLLPFQPIYRFKEDRQGSTSLFQAGTNVFTVNTTPPYRAWDQFRPLIETGLKALIETRPDKTPFFFASVRYIDLFNEDLTGKRSIGRFINEILGIELKLPQLVLDYLPPGGEVRPHLNLTIPLKNGMTMALNLVEGTVKEERGVIMDTTVSSTNKALTADIQSVMATFDSAHEVIRSIFLGLTNKIHAAMEPITGVVH